MAQTVYTYFSTEDIYPSAKLSARNIATVAAGNFSVKLSAPMICGISDFENITAEVPDFDRKAYVYTGVYITNVTEATRHENKRLFKLLDGKINLLGVTVGIPHGTCQYLKFRKVGDQGHIATLSDKP